MINKNNASTVRVTLFTLGLVGCCASVHGTENG